MSLSKANKILVTTTPYLEGWQVKEYFGLITSRVVTGTGIFLDIAASFTDIFGGRSGTYQEQINQITYEVIGLLKEQAFSRGANAVIGTRIDHDEISGKGKQMFMVTATGTAVVAVKDNFGDRSNELLTNDKPTSVTSKHLTKEIEKIKVLNIMSEMGWLDKADADKVWPFIIENQVHEAAPFIIELFKDEQSESYNWFSKATKYFSVIDLDVAKFNLYEGLNNKGGTARRCLRVIKANEFLDFDHALALIDSQDIILQKYSLLVLVCDKDCYIKDDLFIMEKIYEKVVNQFPDLGEQNEANNTWRCKCGKINKEKNYYCKSCSKDIKGFTEGEVKPNEALLSLEEKTEALRSIFQ